MTHPRDIQFTPRGQTVLDLARKIAGKYNHSFVGTEHLLLGIIELGEGTAVSVLKGLGISLEAARVSVEREVGTGTDMKVAGMIPFTPRTLKVLAMARIEAGKLKHQYVCTEHILLGLVTEDGGTAARVLRSLGVEVSMIRDGLMKELDPTYIPHSAYVEFVTEVMRRVHVFETPLGKVSGKFEDLLSVTVTFGEGVTVEMSPIFAACLLVLGRNKNKVTVEAFEDPHKKVQLRLQASTPPSVTNETSKPPIP